MKQKKILFICGAILLISVGFGCKKIISTNSAPTQNPSLDRKAVLLDAKKQGLIMDTVETERMGDPSRLFTDTKKQISDEKSYAPDVLKTWRAAALADVTGGMSYGLAHAQFQNGRFVFVSEVGGLPMLPKEATYAGWLVRRGEDMHVVSLGTLEPANDKFIQKYESLEDLSVYDFYVVTLQSDGKTTSPEEHLLEGQIR